LGRGDKRRAVKSIRQLSHEHLAEKRKARLGREINHSYKYMAEYNKNEKYEDEE
jgi:hypothetical protein